MSYSLFDKHQSHTHTYTRRHHDYTCMIIWTSQKITPTYTCKYMCTYMHTYIFSLLPTYFRLTINCMYRHTDSHASYAHVHAFSLNLYHKRVKGGYYLGKNSFSCVIFTSSQLMSRPPICSHLVKPPRSS